MIPLADISPLTFIPLSDVSNFVTLSCLNSVPAPSVNNAIVPPSEFSLILIALPCINKSPPPSSLITPLLGS